MKTRRWMRYLATTMALALVMSTPLQASEFALEEGTEAVPTAVLDDGAAEDEILSGEETLPPETDPAENTAPTVETSENEPSVEVIDIDEVDSNGAEGSTIGTTTSETFRTGIWLHVVNGNFNGEYGGKSISGEPSVWVQAQCLNQLPYDVSGITVTRTNGTFDGWYTEAPTEELQSRDGYSVWHTVKANGTKIEPGEAIPDGVHVLYAAFKDKDEAKGEVKDEDKLVTFYLDWNGINGQYGHCLSCTRSYKKDGEGVKFTAEDAAVYGLNFKPEYESDFESSADKWSFLKTKWSEDEFDGYTFKGWSTDRHGDPVKEDTPIKDGMSFYAQWEKEGAGSSDDFNPPRPDPLDAIRIVAGDGTTFTSGTLSSGKDAKEGENFKLKLFGTPVGAEMKDVTWTLEVTDGAESLAALFRQSTKTMTVTVNADGSGSSGDAIDGLTVEAKGGTLTITNQGNKVCSIVVSAKATSEDGEEIPATANVTLSFAHTWNAGEQTGEVTCVDGATITYTCACGETKEERIPALGHVYDNRNPDNMKDGQDCRNCMILKAPTCTEAGEKQLKCLRCGALKADSVPISPLGHDWSEEVRTPLTCNKDMVTKHCMRDGCTVQEASQVPASEIHSELHGWTETRRDQISCTEDMVYERCVYCGETRSYKASAQNPHSYEYKSRTSVDCEWVIYTFRCVHCDASLVKYKREENHVWSGWTVSTTLDSKTGVMKRIRTRSCTRCDEEETEDLGDVVVSQPKPESEPEPEPEPESESEQHTELSAEQVTSSTDSNSSATQNAPEMSAPTSSAEESDETESDETEIGETESSAPKMSAPVSNAAESDETESAETEISETEPSASKMSAPASNAAESDETEFAETEIGETEPSAPKMSTPASSAAESDETESDETEINETEPSAPKMSTPASNAAESDETESAETESAETEIGETEPSAPKMSAPASSATEPSVTEPDVAETGETEPSAPKMSAPTPSAAEPSVTEPDAAKTGETEPGAAEINTPAFNATESNATETDETESSAPTTYVQTSGIAEVSAPVVKAPVVSKNDSAVESGWQKVGKKKCYYVDGVKQTGWKKIGKKKYYFGKNGVMQTGWKRIGKKKYYFGKNGVMRTGKQKIGKKTYIFGKNGALKE